MITVFSKEWFKKYNKWIVKLAKIPFIGEWVFRFKNFFFPDDKKLKIEAITKVNKTEKGLVIHREFHTCRALCSFVWYIGLGRFIKGITEGLQNGSLDLQRGAIAYDTATTGVQKTDFSMSHTTSGSNRGLIMAVSTYAYLINHLYTDPTYNSVAMTLEKEEYSHWSSDSIQTQIWSLINPASGTNTFAWNFTYNSFNYMLACISFSGANQTDLVEASASGYNNSETGTSVSCNITTNYDNSYLVSAVCGYYACAITDSGGQTSVLKDNSSWTSTGAISRKSVGVAGSQSMGYSFASPYCPSSICVVAVKEAPTSAPTVTTQSGDQITANSFRGNGNITDTGGASVSRRGFCYLKGSSGTPTTANSVAYDDGSFGTGAYTKTITGLTEDTTYRVRAYAVNSAGTSYGTTVNVTTIAGPANVKTYKGLVSASVKSKKGLAIASIKTAKGLN